jgi:hypothetical protein
MNRHIESIIPQIKLSIEEILRNCAFGQVNDEITRMMIRREVCYNLDFLLQRGDLWEYRVICDGFNNSSMMIDQNELRLVAQLKFSKSLDSFYIDVLVSPKGIEIIDTRIAV